MARVDFYHLTRDSAEAALAMLAGKALGAGQRMMVVSADPAQRSAISRRLWEAPGFLANGEAGGEDDARQPVLIGDAPGAANAAANGAGIVALADGQWRDEALSFDRALLLFNEATIADARSCWRALGQQEKVERHYWSQDSSGRWREGP
ncbi:DNA polymerase III subunit chi [Croceicoccus marinus]|uniref:DNA polymerase III subunit chi n=1 Tax=Croceicoccus marinus TaxID=450378 RepID=A0A7G6VW10_9SPHN|nr:DNA polymerase III subunit chi [Croceicoccus marinus]QNE05925.1 DNA polymerase III subunit chi [Croceicoccus marinus]